MHRSVILTSMGWLLALLPFLVLDTRCRTGTEPEPAARVTQSQAGIRSLQARGQFEADGTSMRRAHPLRIVPRAPSQLHRADDGLFRLVVRYADGTMDAVGFDAFMEGDTDDGRRMFGPFTVEIALKEGVQLERVAVTDAGGDIEYTAWEGDAVPID
jgi:hypothetical protein